ncbi:undecaprenyl-diphosphatase [Gracilibacillus boraciitolerans JCM 21714]|uniref:Undecaprenyl-diphosphatase n=1 Tax=Gracilibacillus boraciitolerans JCM 21714 TaxID=1298598 RepID=W4VPH4_9BACI|nr:undecaprenyl-diphosphate phosphatase [Gracilibacillus boraciitolerans]GAE95280.1 undecaprenyl-diphosphatase [Gracilibacillus boraciitolerans JCM 21714]
MKDILIAFILGIVEGLAEFLPVSSTGHLILVGHLLGFEDERAKTFEIVIQLGAILAITILYRERLVSLFNIKPILNKEKKFNAIHIVLGVFPPAIIAGLLLHDVIKTYLFRPNTVVIGLIAGAILMIIAERKKSEPTSYSLDDLTYRQALTIGLFQCLAVYPGFSRAGSTISGGLLSKASYKASSEFSFLIALPVMVGATGLDLLKNWNHLSVSDIPMFLVGFITSFVVAMLAVVTFLKWLEILGLTPFAYYRIVIAILFTIFVLL